MNEILGWLAPRERRGAFFALLAASLLALAGALLVGVSDNPPGIALLYAAALALVAAGVRNWRRARPFLILLGVSLLGFPVAVVLHNVFEGLGGLWPDVPLASGPLNVLGVIFFFMAILVCPATLLVGLIGTIVFLLRDRRVAAATLLALLVAATGPAMAWEGLPLEGSAMGGDPAAPAISGEVGDPAATGPAQDQSAAPAEGAPEAAETGAPAGATGIVERASPADAARRAFELRMAGKTDEAIRLLEEARRGAPEDAQLAFELSRCRFYLMEFGEAREAARLALRASPDSARYQGWAGLVEGYDGIYKVHNPLTWPAVPGRFRRSRGFLEKSLELDPGAREVRLRLVEMLHGLPWLFGGSSSRAEEQARVLESQDEVDGARARSLLLSEKDTIARLTLWQGVVARHGDSAQVHLELGKAYQSAGETEKAEEQLARALELAAPGEEILAFLAGQWIRAKQYERAAQAAHRYMEVDPAVGAPIRAYGLQGLSHIERARGNTARAEEFRAEAAKVDPHYWPTMMPPPSELFAAP